MVGINKVHSASASLARAISARRKHELGTSATTSSASIAHELVVADEFEYHDPVDGSVASHQGIRFIMKDGSRVVFRLSGTGVGGATVRLYLERYTNDPELLDMDTAAALESLVSVALELSKIEQFTGRNAPSVIT